jgi:hypothetical protein
MLNWIILSTKLKRKPNTTVLVDLSSFT